MEETKAKKVHCAPRSYNSLRPSRSAEAAADVASVTFTWGEVHNGSTGNCHEANGTLVLYADGRGRWSCRTWTDQTHSGDEWDCWFGFKDDRGFLITETADPHSNALIVGIFKSPRMSDGGPRYDWSADFVFRADRYDAIAAAASSAQWATC
jgi:hypothetical protein